MLDAAIKNQLQAYLGKVTHDVEITASLDNSEKSQEIRTMLQEITALSSRLSYRESNEANERKPSFALNRVGSNMGVRFAGIPMGHEFTSLVLALLQVGGHPPKASDEVMELIRNLEGEYVFETYISLSCQNCPEVVQALNLMAVINPNIRHTMIDGALFQDEVNERKIMAVPTVFLNGQHFGQGRMELEEILAKLDTGAAARAAEKIAKKEVFDLLVVGGGRGGCIGSNLCGAKRHSNRRGG